LRRHDFFEPTRTGDEDAVCLTREAVQEINDLSALGGDPRRRQVAYGNGDSQARFEPNEPADLMLASGEVTGEPVAVMANRGR